MLISFLFLPLFTARAAGEPRESVDLPVLMYHQMSQKQSKEGKYVVSVKTFEADLDYLQREGYESITVRQLFDWYDGKGTLPEKPVLITFDDGYESTLAYAGPLLKQHGFTAVVAVIGSVADQYTALPDHDLAYSHLSWEAAAEMAREGVFEIQCHTFDMHSLESRRGCAPKKWEEEWAYRAALSKDLQTFLQRCGQYGVDCVMSIAYPFGSYTAATVEIVKELGFRASFTCEERVNCLTGDTEELYHLYRFNRPGGISTEDFFSKLK